MSTPRSRRQPSIARILVVEAFIAVFLGTVWFFVAGRNSYLAALIVVLGLISGAIAMIWLGGRFRRASDDPPPPGPPTHCPACNYDFAGLPPNSPCPECGQSEPAARGDAR